MSKISCDVTKDLLPAYLDGICSEESKKLVEEHLEECASCREFIKKLQEKDLEKEAEKVDFLKKVRRSMDLRSLIGLAVPVLLLFVGTVCINQNGIARWSFYYVEMPILMLLYAFALAGDVGKEKAAKKEWKFPVFGAVIAGAALGLYLLFPYWLTHEGAAPLPLWRMGPFMHWTAMSIAVAAIIMLALLLVAAKKKGKVFLVSQNLAWLGLNLVLALDYILYKMDEIGAVLRLLPANVMILTAEFLVVTIVLIWLRRTGDKRRAAI